LQLQGLGDCGFKSGAFLDTTLPKQLFSADNFTKIDPSAYDPWARGEALKIFRLSLGLLFHFQRPRTAISTPF